jgi:hypothetical protein
MACFFSRGLKYWNLEKANHWTITLLRVCTNSDGLIETEMRVAHEIKPSIPCRNIVRYAKNHLQVWTETLRKAKFSFLSVIPPPCYQMTLLVVLPETSGGWISLPLSTSFHYVSPCSYHLRDEQLVAAVQRRSFIPSTYHYHTRGLYSRESPFRPISKTRKTGKYNSRHVYIKPVP